MDTPSFHVSHFSPLLVSEWHLAGEEGEASQNDLHFLCSCGECLLLGVMSLHSLLPSGMADTCKETKEGSTLPAIPAFANNDTQAILAVSLLGY